MHVISVQRIIGPRKLIFYHLKVYIYEVYVFIKFKNDSNKLRRFQKLASKVYIGYLVGYKSMNIYKVWILYKKKVVSA